MFQVNAKIRAKWQKNVQRTGILLLIYKLEVHGHQTYIEITTSWCRNIFYHTLISHLKSVKNWTYSKLCIFFLMHNKKGTIFIFLEHSLLNLIISTCSIRSHNNRWVILGMHTRRGGNLQKSINQSINIPINQSIYQSIDLTIDQSNKGNKNWKKLSKK